MTSSRELSPQEEAFLQDFTAEVKDTSLLTGGSKSKSRRLTWPKSPWLSPFNLLWFLPLLPLLFLGLFLVGVQGLKSRFGMDLLNWIYDHRNTSEVQEKLAAGGLTWLPKLINLIHHEGLIIAILISSSLLLFTLVACLRLLLTVRGRRKQERKEALQA